MSASLSAMRARLGEIEAELRAIHEEAGEEMLSEEQQLRWEGLEREQEGLNARIAEEEEREERARRVEESRARWGSLHIDIKPESADLGNVRSLRYGEARDQALRTLESREADRFISDDSRAKVERVIRHRSKEADGGLIARRLLVSESPAYRSAFQKAMTSASPAFTPEEARAIEEMRAMSIGSDTFGGFGVPVLIDPTIILTDQGSLNPFRRISRQVTITTDSWKGVSSAGVSWSFDAEGSAVSDDSPSLAQPEVEVHTARGFIPFSIEVGMDYPSFAEEMGRLLAEGYDELQAEKFAVGSGSGEPTGILTALDSNTNVEVVTLTDGTFQGRDIARVWSQLPDRYKSNATWVMSHAVGNDIAEFGNGNNLSFVTVDLTGVVETIRTRPVEYSSYFPGSLATTGAANILVVGDFRNYLIADRAGMSVEFVPHLFDVTNNRPTGQRGWFAWARTGANSVNDNGFRLLQNQ